MRNKCKRGHLLVGDNLYTIPSSGKRKCRTCSREVWEPKRRQAERQRMGLPPVNPYRGRYALKQTETTNASA